MYFIYNLLDIHVVYGISYKQHLASLEGWPLVRSILNTIIRGLFYEIVAFRLIFHQNAKYLVSGAGVGQCPLRQTFALKIPTCWYLKCENLRYPMPNLKFALAPTPNSDASQWNIGCVGSQRKMLALAMYISCFL